MAGSADFMGCVTARNEPDWDGPIVVEAAGAGSLLVTPTLTFWSFNRPRWTCWTSFTASTPLRAVSAGADLLFLPVGRARL
ncbi:MAG: hypothetical protein IPI73_05630 [Betaproteobacteria bacterium]|nr:hypothetical protein [Betaproteobacteria bacterium]